MEAILQVKMVLKIIVGLSLLNVWLLQYNKPSRWRGGDAKTMLQEFDVYGLGSTMCYVVGFLKVVFALALIASIWFVDLERVASYVLGLLLTGSILMHTCQQRAMQQGNQPMSAFAANGSGPAGLCGRISFVLGLKGPCFSVTTVCSSSLVAVDAAAQNLQHGRCVCGLVVGVNMISDAVTFLAYGAALAADGKCKTFDASANGLGRGDSCGSLVLSADSNVYAVMLCGSAVNQDGRSASMSAPNGPSQVEIKS